MCLQYVTNNFFCYRKKVPGMALAKPADIIPARRRIFVHHSTPDLGAEKFHTGKCRSHRSGKLEEFLRKITEKEARNIRAITAK